MFSVKNLFRQGLLLCAAALTFTACSSDENEPTPEPEKPLDIQGAHFDETNASTSILKVGEANRQVTYTLTRNSAEGKLVVPVKVISATEGLTIPSDVTFADGSATANFTITAPTNVEEGSVYTFEVELEGADQFSEAGATRFSASIAFPKKHYARMWFSGYVKYYGYFLNDVYELGDGNFILSNLMNSGTDLWVRTDKSATALHEVEVSTSPSFISNDEDNPGCYYVYCWDENQEENEFDGYTQFYPHGKDARVSIEGLCIYVSTDGYQSCVYNPEGRSGWIGCSTVSFSDRDEDLNWVNLNWVITDTPEEDGYDYSEPEPVVVDENSLDQFVGTYTFTGTDPYCEDASLTPAATYQCEILKDGDKLYMTGMLGTPVDEDDNETYFTGEYFASDNTIHFYHTSPSVGGYTADGDNWYYIYDFTVNVSNDENGNIVLTRDGIFYFYAYGSDWLNASYGSMKVTKN